MSNNVTRIIPLSQQYTVLNRIPKHPYKEVIPTQLLNLTRAICIHR